MAIGTAKTQGEFLDAALVLADQLEQGSVYRLLAEHGPPGATATPANTADREVAADLVDDLADEHATDHDDHDDGDHHDHDHDGHGGGDSLGGEADRGRPTLVGDSAYADAATRNTLADRGIDTMAKVPPARNSRGGYTKDDFTIDTGAATVTCPAGNTVGIRESARGGGCAAFGALCHTCPLRTDCTSAARGRVVTIHPGEKLLQTANPAERSCLAGRLPCRPAQR